MWAETTKQYPSVTDSSSSNDYNGNALLLFPVQVHLLKQQILIAIVKQGILLFPLLLAPLCQTFGQYTLPTWVTAR